MEAVEGIGLVEFFIVLLSFMGRLCRCILPMGQEASLADKASWDYVRTRLFNK
jgi:hypothetical protein